MKAYFVIATGFISGFVALLYLYVAEISQKRSFGAVYRAVEAGLAKASSERCVEVRGKHRCLPNVLFIGASKSGTTRLSHALNEHPKINFLKRNARTKDRRLPLPQREIHRFDYPSYNLVPRFFARWDEYGSSPLVHDTNATIVHYTPHYLYDLNVPKRVSQFYPPSVTRDLRFIIVLREPIARAVSSYWFKNSARFVAMGTDSSESGGDGKSITKGGATNWTDGGSVEDFRTSARRELASMRARDACLLDAARKRVAPHVDDILSMQCHTPANGEAREGHEVCHVAAPALVSAEEEAACEALLWPTSAGLRHLDKGNYLPQLTRWLRTFTSSAAGTLQIYDRFHVMCADEYRRQPRVQLARLLAWMGLVGRRGAGAGGKEQEEEEEEEEEEDLGYGSAARLSSILRDESYALRGDNTRAPRVPSDGEDGDVMSVKEREEYVVRETVGQELLDELQAYYGASRRQLGVLIGRENVCPDWE